MQNVEQNQSQFFSQARELFSSYLVSAAIGLIVGIVGAASSAQAIALVNFTNKNQFIQTVGPLSVINFKKTPGTVLGNQYQSLGVTFTDGNDTILTSPAFITDGFGARGSGSFSIAFSTPITEVGFDFPGALVIDLFKGSNFLGSSSQFGGQGSGFFGGISVPSSLSFDRIVVRDWFDNSAFIDNMYVTIVPEPLTILGTATAIGFGIFFKKIR